MEYQVMPDIRAKEKIVGGIFTITQTIPLGLALLVGGGLGVAVFTATSNIFLAIVVLCIGALPFVPFAFITIEKMGDMELFFYLLIKYKYKKQQKIYVNINENQKKRILEEANV